MIKHNSDGFTLIELLIVVVVIAILAAIAIPSYLEYVKSSRRADAMAALGNARLAQERYRANNPTYGTAVQAGIPATSPDGYYNITVTNADNSTPYVPHATQYKISAAPTGAQASDTACNPIRVDQDGNFSPAACAKR